MAVWMVEQTAQTECQFSFIQLMSCQVREMSEFVNQVFATALTLQLLHLLCEPKKQFAKDAEYEDLEHGYMYLCTQIYIRNDSVQQYHDFHYVYIHINLLCP